jgi:glyceraldehyde-3-phosphate dehydrogenase/erythrose-4-phosphate dehydrogenase
MCTRVAMNGFGRIGRAVLHPAIDRDAELDVVAVNHATDADSLAHPLMVDSVYVRFVHPVRVVAGRRIPGPSDTPEVRDCPLRSIPATTDEHRMPRH